MPDVVKGCHGTGYEMYEYVHGLGSNPEGCFHCARFTSYHSVSKVLWNVVWAVSCTLCPNCNIKTNTHTRAAVTGVAAAQLCCSQGVRDPRGNILPHQLPQRGCISSQWWQLPYSELPVGCVSCVNNIPSDATQAIIKCQNVNILAHVVKHNPQQRLSIGTIVRKGRGP